MIANQQFIQKIITTKCFFFLPIQGPKQTERQKEEQVQAESSRQGVIILRRRGDYLVGNGNYLPIDPRQDRRQNRSEGLEGALLVA